MIKLSFEVDPLSTNCNMVVLHISIKTTEEEKMLSDSIAQLMGQNILIGNVIMNAACASVADAILQGHGPRAMEMLNEAISQNVIIRNKKTM
jgi:hypothetical protein